MSVELIAAPIQQADWAVRTALAPVERPTPSPQQEQVADSVFSRDQEQVGPLLLGLHVGLLLARHLAAETFRDADKEQKASGCRCCRT